jgi:hypothetical protein
MMNFDSPNREQCAVYENRTNSPLQALDLMNEVTFVEASRKLAERMMTEGGAASEARLEHGYSLVLARAPSAQQKKVMLRLLGELEKNYKADPKAATDFVHQGESAVPSNLNIAELAAYTGVASLMLNLDEAITKE